MTAEDEESIITKTTPADVYMEMDWTELKKDGTRLYPDKPEKEIIFENIPALVLLLIK